MANSSRGGRQALALMVHAIVATKPRTEEEAEMCNARFARARDFLFHAEIPNMVTLEGADEAGEAARAEAVKCLRAVCAVCGLCAALDKRPP
jgi:hypothetical protein